MKVLTVKQPWASLIVEGIKDVENRTWKCPEKYIGQRVLIHAGLDVKNTLGVLNEEQFDCVSKSNDSLYFASKIQQSWDRGAIIGSVVIVDCVINHPSIWAEKSDRTSLEIGDVVPYKNSRGNIKNARIKSFTTVNNGKLWFNGVDTQTNAKVWYPTHVSIELMGGETIYNWVLANPLQFPTPIPIKGKLGFWDYTPDEELMNCTNTNSVVHNSVGEKENCRMDCLCCEYYRFAYDTKIE